MRNRRINMFWIITRNWTLVGAGVLVSICTTAILVEGQAQKRFANPEAALKALQAATKAKDRGALQAIFGPRIKDFVSGDPVADANDFEEFAAKIAAAAKLEKENDKKVMLLVGTDEWPFAAPIVKVGNQWRFDTDAGVEEVINRRVGANEIAAVLLSELYAVAQVEYFDGGEWDGDQVSEYAQKIASSAGKRDGLYWEKIDDDDAESPLGPLFAYAASKGYKARTGAVKSAPFHGYNFKVLYRQGSSAPGGKYDYIINGNMIAGFALVAYPAKWGISGVMTFIVNQEGRVYESNLGPKTEEIAKGMTEYNPDETWRRAFVQ